MKRTLVLFVAVLGMVSCKKKEVDPQIIMTYDTIYSIDSVLYIPQVQSESTSNETGEILKFTYEYDSEGLLVKESCMDRGELKFIIEYVYSGNTVEATKSYYDSDGDAVMYVESIVIVYEQ